MVGSESGDACIEGFERDDGETGSFEGGGDAEFQREVIPQPGSEVITVRRPARQFSTIARTSFSRP